MINGDNTVIENIEFSGATMADSNGAGIRHQTGHLTVRNSYFHDNENGILTNNHPEAGLVNQTSFDYHLDNSSSVIIKGLIPVLVLLGLT